MRSIRLSTRRGIDAIIPELDNYATSVGSRLDGVKRMPFWARMVILYVRSVSS